MPLTLLLMRHAKSAWSEPGKPELPDLERPLTGKGKRDAARQGEALSRLGLVPEAIICSPARRARSTAKRVAQACGYRGQVLTDDALYAYGPAGYLRTASGLPDSVRVALLVGHNPDISELAERLTGTPSELGTAHVVVLEIPRERWQELGEQPTCRLLRVLT